MSLLDVITDTSEYDYPVARPFAGFHVGDAVTVTLSTGYTAEGRITRFNESRTRAYIRPFGRHGTPGSQPVIRAAEQNVSKHPVYR